MFFRNRRKISIDAKLLAGLDQKKGYDTTRGIDPEVDELFCFLPFAGG